MVKKPIYKKWWFWVIVVIIVGGIASTRGNNESKSTSNRQYSKMFRIIQLKLKRKLQQRL
ncbi:MAG: hypothetical protein V8S74_05770 [Lachnospirales bacterium]